MKPGDVYRGAYTRRPYVVLWVGSTFGPDSGGARCCLAPVAVDGLPEEDVSWDWADRIESTWDRVEDSETLGRTDAR